MMCNLNNQNFCVSYMDVKQEMAKWHITGESGKTPLLNGVSTNSSIDYVNEESESISLNFDKL